MSRLAAVLLLVLAANAAVAGDGPAMPPPAGLEVEREARVVEVIDAGTVLLDDGETVRLAGIEAPALAQGGADALAALVQGRRVGLASGGTRRDRYGRLRAHLVRTDDGAWVQGALLALGLARVHSLVDDRAAVADMLAIERGARAGRRGIWSQPRYRVRAAGEAGARLRGFQLVEGRVKAAAVVRGRGYLNFGADWRTDFTVSFGPRDRRLFEAEGIAVEDYEGRLVRVRGWSSPSTAP